MKIAEKKYLDKIIADANKKFYASHKRDLKVQKSKIGHTFINANKYGKGYMQTYSRIERVSDTFVRGTEITIFPDGKVAYCEDRIIHYHHLTRIPVSKFNEKRLEVLQIIAAKLRTGGGCAACSKKVRK